MTGDAAGSNPAFCRGSVRPIQIFLLLGLLPAIFISPLPRGAILGGMAAAGCMLWHRSRRLCAVYCVLVCAGAAAYLAFSDRDPTSIVERWEIWSATLRGITTWHGHGLGSYYTLFPFLTSSFDITHIRPEHAHNDLLEICFELGAVGVIGYCALAISAIRMASVTGRCILVAFITMGMFAFPLWMPATGFIAAFVAGHAARNGRSLRYLDRRIRMAFRPWNGRNPEVNIFPSWPATRGSKVRPV